MKFCANAFGPIRAVPPEEKDGKIRITFARSSYANLLWVSAIRRCMNAYCSRWLEIGFIAEVL